LRVVSTMDPRWKEALEEIHYLHTIERESFATQLSRRPTYFDGGNTNKSDLAGVEHTCTWMGALQAHRRRLHTSLRWMAEPPPPAGRPSMFDEDEPKEIDTSTDSLKLRRRSCYVGKLDAPRVCSFSSVAGHRIAVTLQDGKGLSHSDSCMSQGSQNRTCSLMAW
jgi:hypothetical protein